MPLLIAIALIVIFALALGIGVVGIVRLKQGAEPGSAVLPPINFDALRTGPSAADLDWALNEGNDGVRIVRRTDRYPTAINDGVVAYEGDAERTADSGLDFRERYYYSAWGRSGSRYSNGYLTEQIGRYGVQSDPVYVCGPWNTPISHQGEEVALGSFPYSWDGEGRVYLSASPDSVAAVQPDNALRIETSYGSYDTGNIISSPRAVEITSLLRQGTQTINLWVHDTMEVYGTDGVGMGTPLYIMRAL